MAVTGQLLTMSLGVDGGFRAIGPKYGRPVTEEDLALAEGVDEELANRAPEFGDTPEEVEKFRDRAFIEILKIYNK